MPSDPPTYINIPLGKGTILRLTPMAYANALKRGRAFLRATQQAVREAEAAAAREAASLAWIEEHC